jgi:hypothetical protein
MTGACPQEATGVAQAEALSGIIEEAAMPSLMH